MTSLFILLFELVGMYVLCMVVMRGAVRKAHKTTDAISKRAQQRRSLANATIATLRKKARTSLELRRSERRRRTDIDKVGREIESLRRQLHEAINIDRKIVVLDDRSMSSPRWLVTVVRWQQAHPDPDWHPGLRYRVHARNEAEAGERVMQHLRVLRPAQVSVIPDHP